MPTISLCMIVRDEESVLGRCLECVKNIADEIIVVDTGSKDKTKEVASLYTDKVYDFEWVDDFSAARNFSFSKAEKDYIMWLDADDVIDSENQRKLKELKSTLEPSADIVMMKYNVAFDDNGNPTFSYYRERLMKRSRHFLWKGAIHEVITPSGNIKYCDIEVLHKKLKVNDPNRNLRIFERLLNDGKVLDTRQKYYYARELYFHERYEDAIKAFKEFFDADDKWIENSINACLDLSRCYMKLDRTNEALNSLFWNFKYDNPRAEICCEIGYIKMAEHKYREAIFWYELALKLKYPIQNGGFSSVDCYGYIPYMQLCVCYDKLGNLQKACEYNDKAGSIKPNDKNYLANKEYFRQQLEKSAK